MYAEQGDWLVIKGTAVGRGISDGHFGLVFPGPNATVQPCQDHDAQVEQEWVSLSRLQHELAGCSGA